MVEEIKSTEKLSSILNDPVIKFVVIDFFAQWCRPCVMFSPTFDQIALKYKNVGFYKIDVDNQDLFSFVADCKIECMPTFCYFINGKLFACTKGANEEEINKVIIETIHKFNL